MVAAFNFDFISNYLCKCREYKCEFRREDRIGDLSYNTIIFCPQIAKVNRKLEIKMRQLLNYLYLIERRYI